MLKEHFFALAYELDFALLFGMFVCLLIYVFLLLPESFCPTVQWHSYWLRRTGIFVSGYGGVGGQSATPDSEKFAKNQEKEGTNQEKLRKKRKNQEGSFTLPLLTDRAGSCCCYCYSLCCYVCTFCDYLQISILKDLMPITFSSPRAQPEVVYFWYQMKAHIFLIANPKFQLQILCSFGDITKSVKLNGIPENNFLCIFIIASSPGVHTFFCLWRVNKKLPQGETSQNAF